MEMTDNQKYHREVTHEKMPTARRKSDFWAGYLPFEITNIPMDKRKDAIGEGKNKNYLVATDEFVVSEESKIIVPRFLGGFSFFMIIGFIFFVDFDWYGSEVWLFVLFFLILILSIIYYFTVPDKEMILNRMDGLVTIPAFTYGKPTTMKLVKMRIIYGGGATGSPSADRLAITRPTWQQTGYNPFFGGSYFEELSFLIWYMDKNRPLPPGDAFDEYRKKDYQRRKEEGFPPPIFRTYIPTPEYKNKWQKERDQHWKDIIGVDEKGNQVHQIWQSAENVQRHGEWEAVVPQ